MSFRALLEAFYKAMIGIFFIVLGVMTFFFPWITSIHSRIIQFTAENPFYTSLIGLALFLLGAAIFGNAAQRSRHRYYFVKAGNNPVAVDTALLQQCLDSYWTELFPDYEIPNEVFLKNNKIHVTATFPSLPLEEQKPLLNRIERDLTLAFRKILGYDEDFSLSASFKT